MTAAGTLTSLVAHYGYLGIALLVGVEGFGMPAPGETAIIAGAGYAAHGDLTVAGVAMAAFLAAVVGDSVGYLIGRTGGRQLILRHGRYVRLTPERFARLEAFMGRNGPKVVVVARFVEGLRQFNGIIAGATGMPWRRFVAYNALGAAAWVGTWVTVGYLAGDHLRAIETELHRYQGYGLLAGILAALAWARPGGCVAGLPRPAADPPRVFIPASCVISSVASHERCAGGQRRPSHQGLRVPGCCR